MVRPLDLEYFCRSAKGGAIMATGWPHSTSRPGSLTAKMHDCRECRLSVLAVHGEMAGFWARRPNTGNIRWNRHADGSLPAVTSRIQLYAPSLFAVHPAVIAKWRRPRRHQQRPFWRQYRQWLE